MEKSLQLKKQKPFREVIETEAKAAQRAFKAMEKWAKAY
jgi:hypothetical protein